MKQYLKRTWKNKLVALVISLLSLVPIWVDGDGTLFVLILPAAIILFFTGQSIIE